MRYKECPYCGAALDHDERCDCQDQKNSQTFGKKRKKKSRSGAPTPKQQGGKRFDSQYFHRHCTKQPGGLSRVKKLEMDEIIKAYILQTGETVSNKSVKAFQQFYVLCIHWEEIGRQDAQSGRLAPPQGVEGSPFTEIIDLLRDFYMDGYNSAKGESENENHHCLSG